MSFLLIPQTDLYYPLNVSDIYLNRNVTDIYLNWNGIFFFENDIDFTTHLVSVKIQTNSLLFIVYFVWFFQVYLDCSFFIFLSQPSLSTLSELYQYLSFQALCMWAHFVNIIWLYPTLSKIPQGFPKVACSLMSLFEHACSSMKFYLSVWAAHKNFAVLV